MTREDLFAQHEEQNELPDLEPEPPTVIHQKVARKRVRESHVERRIASFRKWLAFWSEELEQFIKLYGENPTAERHKFMLKSAKDNVKKYTDLLTRYKQGHGQYHKNKKGSTEKSRGVAPASATGRDKSRKK